MADENELCTCKKTKKRTEDEKRALLNRLSRIEGQINGLKKMVESDCYCIDIITQVSAARAALNSFNKEIMSKHIKTCVAEHVRNGDDEIINELVRTLEKLMK